MGFPPLKKMIQYDVYTVAQLQKYNSGQCQIKKSCVDVKECHRCTFLYKGYSCDNCFGLMTKPSASSRLA